METNEVVEKKEGTETEVKGAEATETKVEKKVDEKKIGEDAVAKYLESLGYDKEALQGIVDKHKADEEKNKTDLEKKDGELSAMTKKYLAERNARNKAEAQLAAIKLGAKPELVEDLVIVASSRVTKEKDVEAVIAEIKDSETGKIYFVDSEEEVEEKETKEKGTITRKRIVTKVNSETKKETKKGNEGTMAERLLGNRKKVSPHYFK